MEILTIGFQGVGPKRQHIDEPTLIKLGHVGVSLDGGDSVYGFHPTYEAVRALMQSAEDTTEKGLIGFLQAGGVLRGGVFDDTKIFLRAVELAKSGARTQVWKVSAFVATSKFVQIRDEIFNQVTYGSPYPSWYGFPQAVRTCDNCATWPRTLGIPIVEETGVLTDFIAKMRELGTPWP